ncbi:MAG: SEC-C metal-binding domain-containing protein, partial [Patescibacteria group bacterium]
FKVQVAVPEHEHVHVHEEPAGGDLGADEAPRKNQESPLGQGSAGQARSKNQKSDTISSSQNPIPTPSAVAATLSSPVPASGPGIGKNKLGRNDPCWCGSGKKYKKCHYPN